jgi:hypothetical protein
MYNLLLTYSGLLSFLFFASVCFSLVLGMREHDQL